MITAHITSMGHIMGEPMPETKASEASHQAPASACPVQAV